MGDTMSDNASGGEAVLTVGLTSEELQTEAKRFADRLGPSPLLWASEWPSATPEVCAALAERWSVMDEFEDGLAEFTGWDAEALRAAAGPPLEVGYHQTWQTLLIGAANTAETRNLNLPVEEVALDVAGMALFGVVVDPHGDWGHTHARHARRSEDPVASLGRAREVLPLEARRRRHSANVVDMAQARLTRALDHL